MNIYSYMLSLLCAISILLIAGCDGEPVFTEMSTNRLKIVLKGTLESENPVSDTFGFTPGVTSASGFADDSVNDVAVQAEDVMPATFMFDISEIKLNGYAIGNYRQVLSIPLDDAEPFFNGSGVLLRNDDPGNGQYTTVQLYIRKMIFDNASVYQNSGTSFVYEEPAMVIFRENEVEGFNFNNLQVNSYWDSLRDNASGVIRIYPLEIPIIGGMNYDRGNDETVLEIRIVIKNFIKMYEYGYYDDGIFKQCHFYAFSDWLRDVRADENDIGRNIHAVARAYVPGKKGTISGSGVTVDGVVVAIPESEIIEDYSIDDTGAALRNNVGWCDLPAPPVYSGGHIESVLEYYLNYEQYKNDWNAAVENHTADPEASLIEYETAWETYEGAVEGFKVAPYITKANGTSYSFSNVAPGRYKIYYRAYPLYGELFVNDGGWIQDGSGAVDVTSGNDTTVP